MSIALSQISVVAAGGALGAAGRFAVGSLMGHWLGPDYPWGTLTVNILGSIAMGLLIGLFAHFGTTQSIRLFLAVGFLGAFTTFSTFSLDVITLIERGETTFSALYIAGSMVGAIGGLFLGLYLTRMVFSQ
ncbi:MAG TPA: fluoride efflux transporter CrcB [Rhodospirillaceae bacterium]|nr:fluoride efflux transporter CrcB [Alphaproteobacteria bacterium]OUT41628.1 MAG: hypothetical protein CBB62_04680 [Micavibrio sp. TMED2]HCI46581.1 fluoride efflux transporter CrcB [Rhodospirillaceae bacterium]MAS46807.1 fluoride efflux transporter CrcB [Alphaproteobacteria bacterium]MAX94902.1 fluoride efflux transporter CrcB [Alphaproteobacteria bacterium]|tara:strand:+ start:51850 stop:52242 length:393 start_codon:yes stop_codon:yes gene_type:complete